MSRANIIGGEYKILPELLNGKYLNDICPSYSLGRTCLYSILDHVYGSGCQKSVFSKRIKSEVGRILLPDYICISVAEVPQRLGLQIKHYHVRPDLTPDYDSVVDSIYGCSSIILISYFGIVNLDECIKNIRIHYPDVIVIVDDVQNFYGFGKHVDYDYCFSSYRKWFCSPDGADVISKDQLMLPVGLSEEPLYVQYKTAGNLLKNYTDWINDVVPLEEISKGEKLMDESYLCRCSKISRDILRRTNFEDAKKRREMNAAFLHERLDTLGIKHFYNSEMTPLFVPISIESRDVVRKSLFSDNIFAPIHWPLYNSFLQGNNELYNTELSLICDQRYDEEDMERIIRGITNAI